MFPPTRWTLVEDIRGGGEKAERALEELCGIYWFPVYAYARWSGASAPDAEDLTQGFFARLLERKDLESAQGGKGRLRSYLLSCLKHYSASEHRKQTALKRGGGTVTVPIDLGVAEERLAAQPAEGRDPAQLFEQQWASGLLDEAFARLEKGYLEAGKEALYGKLSPFLAGRPDSGDRYEALGEELGMTAGAVQVAVHRMRKRYRDHLGEVVGETLQDPAELEDELRYILRVVGGG